jgi:hypothetical protein
MSVHFPVLVSDIAFPYIFQLTEFYLIFFLSILLCLGRDFIYKAYKREFQPEYYHILQEFYHQKQFRDQIQEIDIKLDWTPPELKYKLFEADLNMEKPLFSSTTNTTTTSTERASIVVTTRPRSSEAYTGFAYSTPSLEDRFFNPLRELVLPVRAVVDIISEKLNGVLQHKGEEENTIGGGRTRGIKTFEQKIKELPIEQQEVYEIQRFQIFAGWGNSLPGHLFINDPPRFCNADFTDGASTFDFNTGSTSGSSTEWIVDTSFGNNDQWQYGTKFKDFLRAQTTGTTGATTISSSRKDKKRLKKRLNKLVGRSVRRRRWIRKKTTNLSSPTLSPTSSDGESIDLPFSLPSSPST